MTLPCQESGFLRKIIGIILSTSFKTVFYCRKTKYNIAYFDYETEFNFTVVYFKIIPRVEIKYHKISIIILSRVKLRLISVK